jgi:hypothetical protein
VGEGPDRHGVGGDSIDARTERAERRAPYEDGTPRASDASLGSARRRGRASRSRRRDDLLLRGCRPAAGSRRGRGRRAVAAGIGGGQHRREAPVATVAAGAFAERPRASRERDGDRIFGTTCTAAPRPEARARSDGTVSDEPLSALELTVPGHTAMRTSSPGSPIEGDAGASAQAL